MGAYFRSNRVLRTLLVAGVMSATPLCAQTFVWNLNGDGSWATNANWNPNTGNPDAVGATA